jgi:hypothetical protein
MSPGPSAPSSHWSPRPCWSPAAAARKERPAISGRRPRSSRRARCRSRADERPATRELGGVTVVGDDEGALERFEKARGDGEKLADVDAFENAFGGLLPLAGVELPPGLVENLDPLRTRVVFGEPGGFAGRLDVR